MNHRCRILLVGKEDSEVRRINRLLQAAGVGDLLFARAKGPEAAIEELHSAMSHLVLLDLESGDGIEQMRVMLAEFPDLPIIIQSTVGDDDSALAAIHAGAQDFLVRGRTGPLELARAVRLAIGRQRIKSEMRDRSIRDELTGLFNRRGFLEHARRRLARAQRGKERLHLLFADLDGLKDINDELGHPAGDQVIQDAARLLHHTFRTTDIIGRLGGDEFVVLLSEASEGTDQALVERLEGNLLGFNTAVERPYRLSMSVGLALFDPVAPAPIEEILERADGRMYDTKRLRRRSVAVLRRRGRLQRASRS